MSGGHQNRPFSPYRHGPTNEDLLHAAVRGRGIIIPEVPSKAPSSRAKSPIGPPSPPASPKSRNSKAPSLFGKQPSVVPSHRTGASKVNGVVDGEKTPTPSRPHTPEELDAHEQQIVDTIASAARTPRTSYYSPSTLEPDVAAQYHDMELCVLFAQLNDPKAHEFIKKAVRKAVRQRVKRLGMKYDNEVGRQPSFPFSCL